MGSIPEPEWSNISHFWDRPVPIFSHVRLSYLALVQDKKITCILPANACCTLYVNCSPAWHSLNKRPSLTLCRKDELWIWFVPPNKHTPLLTDLYGAGILSQFTMNISLKIYQNVMFSLVVFEISSIAFKFYHYVFCSLYRKEYFPINHLEDKMPELFVFNYFL